MYLPTLGDGIPFIAYDSYAWCHPTEVDFGDFLNLDHFVYERTHHLVPFYVRAMCSLATALGIAPAHVPLAPVSNLSTPGQELTVDDAISFYALHFRDLLHPPKNSAIAIDLASGAIYSDLIPLRSHLIEIIYATNWRGEGENNVPYYFELWKNPGFVAACEEIVYKDLPALKRSVVPRIERIDRALFQGLFPDLVWQTISLSELKSTWGYPAPKTENKWD